MKKCASLLFLHQLRCLNKCLHKDKDANQGQLVLLDISSTWRTFAGMIIMIMINTTVIFDSIAVGPGKGSIELTHLMFLLDRPKHDSEV